MKQVCGRLAWMAVVAIIATSLAPRSRAANLQDHFEFEGQLSAPYRADLSSRRDVDLLFRFPGALPGTVAVWRVDLVDPAGRVLRAWRGQTRIDDGKGNDRLSWFERDPQNGLLAAGIYQLRLRATTLDVGKLGIVSLGSQDEGIDAVLASGEFESQSWPIQIGEPARPSMPLFKRLAAAHLGGGANGATTQSVPATGSLPYTVYLGNLHSQTNHSDGGGALSSCTGAQNPQTGALGPTDAFTYALGHGLDFLMASEHNHLYDGSTGTNTAATPASAHNLYQSGLAAATNFNSAHPNFLAIYGMEWGVINNGGHLNIFNSPELLEWEYNSSNQLIGDTLSPKGDYAALYTQMKTRGWIGQFNHPAETGQFVIGTTPLAYSADGDQVMVACEVMNTSAFSTNTTETETGLSSYETACTKLLEAGYHIAFTTDQDNHCANWGASYTNRNGVLIPSGTALSTASFLDALRARRVYATTDKTSQLVLTANGHLMGETFSNAGSLTLTASYAPGAGRSATQVQIFQGVPGSNGTVSVLATTATTTITPTTGAHFYYAKITQDNGKLLWSAPVWVNQGSGGGDTTPPTVTASETGSSGTITLSATASDNVGVSRVEFSIDGTLVATDSTSPYSATYNSASLTNGGHSLVARAYDAAGNVGTSSAVSFSVSNTTNTPTQLAVNGGFESGTASWTASTGVITNGTGEAAHAGTYKAWLDGYGTTTTDTLLQTITIPSTASTVTFSFYLHIDTAETTTTTAYDKLSVQVRNSAGSVLATLATYSNLNAATGYTQRSFSLAAYKGQSVQLFFSGVEDSQKQTSFVIDDVSVVSQ